MQYRPSEKPASPSPISASAHRRSELCFTPSATDECIATVHAALDGGINFIDVSPAYGGTLAELNLGRALQGVARDRYLLATKIGSYSEARNDYDYSRAATERSVEHSLVRLGVDHIDLIQIP